MNKCPYACQYNGIPPCELDIMVDFCMGECSKQEGEIIATVRPQEAEA